MAPRPSWRGTLRLSLVSCPVALFSAATATRKVAFHLLNRATSHRLRRQMVDGETGEVVDTDDQIHGYEVGPDDYVMVEDDEIDALRIESSHTIDVSRFVARAEVDDVYLDTPYYLAPDGGPGEEAFAVIREAMRRGKTVGIASLVLARREHVVMIEPAGRGLLLTTLRFPYELKPAADVFDEIGTGEVSDEMLDLADHIIRSKRGAFEPDSFEDHYENALRELIEAKQAGRPMKAGPEPDRPDNVIDLMEALRRSVGQPPKKTGQAGKAKADAEPKAKAKAGAKPKAGTEPKAKTKAKAKPKAEAKPSAAAAKPRARKAG